MIDNDTKKINEQSQKIIRQFSGISHGHYFLSP